jgi:hypothetical protein
MYKNSKIYPNHKIVQKYAHQNLKKNIVPDNNTINNTINNVMKKNIIPNNNTINNVMKKNIIPNIIPNNNTINNVMKKNIDLDQDNIVNYHNSKKKRYPKVMYFKTIKFIYSPTVKQLYNEIFLLTDSIISISKQNNHNDLEYKY